MSDKEMVIEVVQSLPDDASLERIREEIALFVAIQRAKDDIKAGRTVSHAEVMKQLAAWTKS